MTNIDHITLLMFHYKGLKDYDYESSCLPSNIRLISNLYIKLTTIITM